MEQDEAAKRNQDAAAKKAAEEQRKKELAELFKPIQQQQKVPFGWSRLYLTLCR
jgi:hypothetical protein